MWDPKRLNVDRTPPPPKEAARDDTTRPTCARPSEWVRSYMSGERGPDWKSTQYYDAWSNQWENKQRRRKTKKEIQKLKKIDAREQAQKRK